MTPGQARRAKILILFGMRPETINPVAIERPPGDRVRARGGG
jgi:hypothetical protein